MVATTDFGVEVLAETFESTSLDSSMISEKDDYFGAGAI